MKQGLLYLSLCASLSCSYLTAATPVQQDTTQNNPTATPQRHSAQPARKAPPKNVVLASDRPNLENGWGIIVSGDYLYWQASQAGLEYTLKSPDVNNRFNKGSLGKISNISPNYQSGFRVGADIELPHDNWDISFAWTSYSNQTHSRRGGGSTFTMTPYWLNAGEGITTSGASTAKWNLGFNSYDLDLGCAFLPRQHLSLRPFAGFKAAWIEQDFTVKYHNISSNNTLAPGSAISMRSRNYNHFQGYGMRVGMDTKWLLNYGFSFIGNISGALLASEFYVSQFDRNVDHTPRSHTQEYINRITPVVEMFGGLKWETDFDDEGFFLDIHAGWEQQIWFSQNQMNNFPIPNNRGYAIKSQGDLTLSGLTVGATFGF